jgi:RimJ/RimL family protein N-acetyltransferase
LVARLARRCADEKLGRLEWSVLNWNAPSIAFYESLGTRLMNEWTMCRLEGEALFALASKAREAT